MGYSPSKVCLDCDEPPLSNARRCASCLMRKAEEKAEETSPYYGAMGIDRAKRIIAGVCISIPYHDPDDLPPATRGQRCEACAQPRCKRRDEIKDAQTCLQLVSVVDNHAPMCAPCIQRGGKGFREKAIERQKRRDIEYENAKRGWREE